MLELSRRILRDFQIRKTRGQKAAFYALIRPALEAYGYDVTLEEGGLIKSRNIVVGDIQKADVILTAHYDTCAQLPFPNYIFPQKIGFYLAWQLLITAALVGIYVLALFAAYALTRNVAAASCAGFAAGAAGLYLLLAGKANRHNYNDNTSGVVTVIETALSLSAEQMKKAAFVLFDNEELGMVGSARFANQHNKKIAGKPLINFDCVSDGDTILLIPDKAFKRDERSMEALRASFTGGNGKNVHINEKKLFYPSDQAMFKKAVGVAAMKHSKYFGLYLDRIHTARDTVFDEENIALIKNALISMIDRIGL